MKCYKFHIYFRIVAEGGDSWGISGKGETPQWSEATEEAHLLPPGKRPPEAEIRVTMP
ncbi:hypothetical protein SLU01_10740 [Sporosarcina luteola]|uniref:Uncharacterized protein n=1 Tax=Sporosarcina luteola TaxID=582850 RepID=A0A511Z5T1_9BACL|nr:hypothetical protein SLU01_10740 [Sporosarcina luteola]